MIIQICCFLIFITYFAICALLSYYFIKKRTIWDSMFSSNTIWNLLTELILCPEHFLIWIPCIEFENTSCSTNKKLKDNAKLQVKKVLVHIKNQLDLISNINSVNNNCDINLNIVLDIDKTKWLIEGTMKDFERIYDETAEFYNKLANSYDILYNKSNNSNNSNKSDSAFTIEDLVILEYNVEICENISNILSIFNNYKLLFIDNVIESGYMRCLLYDIIENIKIYKILCLLEINK